MIINTPRLYLYDNFRKRILYITCKRQDFAVNECLPEAGGRLMTPAAETRSMKQAIFAY
jgi:hypothetical protein